MDPREIACIKEVMKVFPFRCQNTRAVMMSSFLDIQADACFFIQTFGLHSKDGVNKILEAFANVVTLNREKKEAEKVLRDITSRELASIAHFKNIQAATPTSLSLWPTLGATWTDVSNSLLQKGLSDEGGVGVGLEKKGTVSSPSQMGGTSGSSAAGSVNDDNVRAMKTDDLASVSTNEHKKRKT